MARRGSVIVLAIACWLPAHGSSPGSRLLPDPLVPCAQDPRGMKTADFNGDGFPDLAVAGQNVPWSSVLLGRGDGTFESTRIPGTLSNDLAVGDFDGDGDVDIVEPTGRDIDFHAGRGDGTFELPIASGCAGCEDYWWLQAADFDDDGRLDLIATTYDSAPLSGMPLTDFLLLGDGTGRFEEPTILTEPGYFGTIGIGDLDDDGHLDAVDSVSGRGEVCFRFGNGDGTFQHDPLEDCLAIERALIAGTGDLDHDGNVDVVTLSYQSDRQMIVLLGDGSGGFEPLAPVAFDVRIYGQHLADVDGDGLLDVVGVGGNILKVLKGRGDGTFDPERQFGPLGFGPVAHGDFDADGRPDIAVASVSGSVVQVVRGRRDGSFEDRATHRVPLQQILASAVASGDFDEDGDADVAVAYELSPGTVAVLLGDGAGSFADETPFTAGDRPCAIASAHLDAGGDLDIVTGNCGSFDASVLLGHGDGTFAPELRVPIGFEPRGVVAAHFDDDLRMDLAFLGAAPDNVVRLFLGNGDGTFALSVERSVGPDPSSMDAADLDGNGTVDIVVANESTGDVSLLFGDGMGGLAAEVRTDVVGAPVQVIASDLDLDSRTDLVLRFAEAADGIAYLLATDGGYSEPIDVPLPAELVAVFGVTPRAMAVGDLDLDRYPDLLVMTSTPAVLFMGSADGFREHGSFAAWGSPLLSDLDGDTRPDVILLNSSSIDIQINQGPTTTAFEADKITLSWPSIWDALTYSVYRGTLSDLVDTDLDGRPDSDYGVCIADLDDDTTDNSIVDAEIPATGQGFFYLSASTDSVGERDLGYTSAGLPRFPALPCP